MNIPATISLIAAFGKKFLLPLACAALYFYFSLNARAEEAPVLTPQDFAEGFAVSVPNPGALYKIDLPDACLALSLDPDNRDIAVFNAGGVLLPLAPYYPSATFKSEHLPAQITTALWKMNESSPPVSQNTVIIVDKDRLAAAPLEEAKQKQIVPAAYLAVLPRSELTLTGIDVLWTAEPLTQIVRVRVECADNLNDDNWRLLADGPLARVPAQEGFSVENTHFALPGVKAGKYLKISFPELNAAPELQSVSVDAQQMETPEFKSLSATLHPVEVKDPTAPETPAAVFEIDLAGRKWVNSLELTPASPVIWRDVVLLGRDNDKRAWQKLGTFTAFSIVKDGSSEPVRNRVLSLQTELPRHLRIEVPPSARGKADFNLKMLYLQPGLIFQAQAPAPYTLACGSGKARVEGDIEQALLAMANSSGAEVSQNSKELGGAEALEVTTSEGGADSMRLALWGVLALGVVALGGMSFVLYRNIKKEK